MVFMCSNSTPNLESLYSAIIPAVAGIIVFLLGFFANTFSKYLDNKDKRRQKQIESFEFYYNPLAEKLYSFLCHIGNLKRNISNEDLPLTYSLLVSTDRVVLNPFINEIKEDVSKILISLSTLTYRHSGDFKVEFYRDKTFEFLTEFDDIIKTNKKDNRKIPFEVVENLLVQIETMVNPTCWIYRKYMQCWKNRETKKYAKLYNYE
jgi:hypothetical protein